MNFIVSNEYMGNNCDLRNVVILVKDNWDDWFTYETKYYVQYINKSGHVVDIGAVKIGQIGMEAGQRSANIPDSFEKLDELFFSLGQSDIYYENISSLGSSARDNILSSLNDIAYDPSIYRKVKSLNVTRVSLMRDVSNFMITRQFSRIAHGNARLTEYKIEYTYPNDDEIVLDFCVEPESNPPTNVHAIIGRNNVEKTYLLRNLINSIYFPEEKHIYGKLRSTNNKTGRLVNATTQAFANVICVSFSPFDDYTDIENKLKNKIKIPFSFIGLNSNNLYESLIKDFLSSLDNCIFNDNKKKLLMKALQILETDIIFERSNIGDAITSISNKVSSDTKNHLGDLFKKLSSGHQVILLTLTRLISKITERSLVILDEPENHLHPPLLSAFIRALSELLIDRNGVAIVATHSPVVLQEIPKSCIWRLDRTGSLVTPSRLDKESFAASISLLTHEVFGLEVKQSGFYKILTEKVDSGLSYKEIIELFDSEIGDEGKALIRTLIALRDKNETS